MFSFILFRLTNAESWEILVNVGSDRTANCNSYDERMRIYRDSTLWVLAPFAPRVPVLIQVCLSSVFSILARAYLYVCTVVDKYFSETRLLGKLLDCCIIFQLVRRTASVESTVFLSYRRRGLIECWWIGEIPCNFVFWPLHSRNVKVR
jgi:hypothetical protein